MNTENVGSTQKASSLHSLVGRLRSQAKQLTELAAMFDETEVSDYKWNVEEAESFLSRTADAIARCYRLSEPPNESSSPTPSHSAAQPNQK